MIIWGTNAFESLLMAFLSQVLRSPSLFYVWSIKDGSGQSAGFFFYIRRLRIDESLVPLLNFYSTFKHSFYFFILLCHIYFI